MVLKLGGKWRGVNATILLGGGCYLWDDPVTKVIDNTSHKFHLS